MAIMSGASRPRAERKGRMDRYRFFGIHGLEAGVPQGLYPAARKTTPSSRPISRHSARCRSSSAATTCTSAKGLPDSSSCPPGSMEMVSCPHCEAMMSPSSSNGV